MDGSVIQDYEKQIEIIDNIFSVEEVVPFHLILATHLYEKCSVCYAEKRTTAIFFKLIQSYIEKYGVESMFKLGQISTTALFGIWKEVDSDDYNLQVNNFIRNDEFNVVGLVNRMIDDSDEKYYKKFCELFDADMIFDKLNKIDPEVISENQSSIGYFLRKYKK